jgi:hypothetical protein
MARPRPACCGRRPRCSVAAPDRRRGPHGAIVGPTQRPGRARISRATREQNLGIEQVGSAIQQIDRMTQQNSALVEESAAATSSLQSQADKLVDAVRTFRLTAVV